MTKKRIQIPHITVDNPELQRFIDALIHNDEMDKGQLLTSEKRPTVQDMIDAGIANAENIK